MVLKLRVDPPDDWRDAKCLGTVRGPHIENEEDQRLRDPFFEDHPVAREFCNGTADGVVCPIREQCLRFALVNNCREGVWGGMGEASRKALRRRWPPRNVREAREEWQWMPDDDALRGIDLSELEDDDE